MQRSSAVALRSAWASKWSYNCAEKPNGMMEKNMFGLCTAAVLRSAGCMFVALLSFGMFNS